MTESLNLFHIPFPELFEKIKSDFNHYSYDFAKHIIEIKHTEGEKLGFLRLPLHLSIDADLNIQETENEVLYLSIESGNAAIILMHGKKQVYHTTFGAYMTRKKQGFSQIKYLKKKGKSRAGSRVRLAAGIEFFEKINEKTTELSDNYNIKRIALNCSTTLIPFLFQSKIPPPFNKKDSRLYKIPLHIPQSNFTNLEAAIKKLLAPTLFYVSKFEEELAKSFEIKNSYLPGQKQ